jgi:isoamylase
VTNRSWNCGAEGPTNDPEIVALRGRQMRNMLATLLLSQGTPMIMAGDEFGRTQRGNNNAYCQDNEISWIDWTLCEKNQAQVRFARQLTELRRQYPVPRIASQRSSEGNSVAGTRWHSWTRPSWSVRPGHSSQAPEWHSGEMPVCTSKSSGKSTNSGPTIRV